MSEKITNEQYAQLIFNLQAYIKQLNKPIDLECMQNILLSMIQEINRQIVKVKEYEAIQQIKEL